jgi:ribosomal protein S18 acetylase RimI-like enzyme
VITVRRAAVEDAVAIAQVSVASWRAAYDGIMPAAILAALSVEELAQSWRQRLGDAANPAVTFVAEQAGHIVGFASVGPARDDDLEEGVGELWAIYVDPTAWGTGAGDALWREALAALRALGLRTMVLWVLRDNHRARSFYQRRGFVLDGAEKTPAEGVHVRLRRGRTE